MDKIIGRISTRTVGNNIDPDTSLREDNYSCAHFVTTIWPLALSRKTSRQIAFSHINEP